MHYVKRKKLYQYIILLNINKKKKKIDNKQMAKAEKKCISHFMAKFSWGSIAQFIFILLKYWHGENGK